MNMVKEIIELKSEFIEGYIQKLLAGFEIPETDTEQIERRFQRKMYPGGAKEILYMDAISVLEFNLVPMGDKIKIIFKVLKI